MARMHARLSSGLRLLSGTGGRSARELGESPGSAFAGAEHLIHPGFLCIGLDLQDDLLLSNLSSTSAISLDAAKYFLSKKSYSDFSRKSLRRNLMHFDFVL